MVRREGKAVHPLWSSAFLPCKRGKCCFNLESQWRKKVGGRIGIWYLTSLWAHKEDTPDKAICCFLLPYPSERTSSYRKSRLMPTVLDAFWIQVKKKVPGEK